jgi:hypothetical protein
MAVEKPLVGELVVQQHGLFATLGDGNSDGPETALFVRSSDSEFLHRGDELGKRLKARSRRLTFVQESEEPSHDAQNDQEKKESSPQN